MPRMNMVHPIILWPITLVRKHPGSQMFHEYQDMYHTEVLVRGYIMFINLGKGWAIISPQESDIYVYEDNDAGRFGDDR